VRTLLVSDLHYNLPQLDWVLDAADDVDLLVIAGDFLQLGYRVPLDAQIVVVLEYLARAAERATVVVCSGNHDLDERNDADEKVTTWIHEARAAGVIVDGESREVDGWLVTSCAWWEGPDTLASMEAGLARAAAERAGRPWMWAYHGPPEGPLSWTGKRHFADPELPRLLEEHQPDIVLCGHIHEAPFVPEGAWAEQVGGAWLFNSGRQRGPQPPHIVLDLEPARRVATWSSAERTDTVALDDGALIAQ
jgi:Icc-related predicted phosphoesterase